jgi:predicted alpha/beta-fold hydrolase
MTNKNSKPKFTPPLLLSSSFVQTFLNSARFRNKGIQKFDVRAREILVDCGESPQKGGRELLQAFIAEHVEKPKGLVIIIHGWEGSHNSAYMISTGRYFFNKGYNVCRLNLRDHGTSHRLNEGFFLGTMSPEAFIGVKDIIEKYSMGLPAFLIGFSMGGHFSVRIAKHASDENYQNLKRVVAINPPYDPYKSLKHLDRSEKFRLYFVRKWKRSLQIKQELFPHLYDFNDLLKMNTSEEMSVVILERYTNFKDLTDYYARYTLTDGWLDKVTIPLTVVMSKNDPIIAYEDMVSTKMSPAANLILQNNGGHCGYIKNYKFESWYTDVLYDMFETDML